MTSFSILGMFLQAGIIVQIVAGILILMSVYSWSIIIRKSIGIRRYNQEVDLLGEKIYHASSTNLLNQFQIAQSHSFNPLSKIILVMKDELIRSKKLDIKLNKDSILQRIQKKSDIAIEELLHTAQQEYTFLGTIGAISPFIGLFGTVWGIMNSFQHISKTQNTGLAVVAPGIAEALFVTALGLLVAIPAVIFYNRINNQVNEYETLLTKYTDHALSDFSYNLDVLSENGTKESSDQINHIEEHT